MGDEEAAVVEAAMTYRIEYGKDQSRHRAAREALWAALDAVGLAREARRRVDEPAGLPPPASPAPMPTDLFEDVDIPPEAEGADG